MRGVRTGELASVLGVSGRRVRQLVKLGMPRLGRGRFELRKCQQWYVGWKVSRERPLGPKKVRACKGCGGEPDPRSPYCPPCREAARERSKARRAPRKAGEQGRRESIPEWVAIASRMWEAGYDVGEICLICGVSSPSLYVYKRLGDWDQGARDRGRYQRKYPWLEDARQKYEAGDLLRELAGVYGVSDTTMRALAKEMAWGHRAHRKARFQRHNPVDGRRVCKQCKEEKEIADYPTVNDSRRKQGRRKPICSDCWTLYRRAYRHENPDQRRLWSKRRSRRMRDQSDGSLTRGVLVRLYGQATSKCPYCTTTLKKGNRSLDHIEPLSKGGCHSLSNVIVCCRDCNTRKRDREFADWLATLDDVQRASAERAYRSVKGASHEQRELTLAA